MVLGVQEGISLQLACDEVHGYVLIAIFSALTAALAPLAWSPEHRRGVCFSAVRIACH